jgi:hypothetical protein
VRHSSANLSVPEGISHFLQMYSDFGKDERLTENAFGKFQNLIYYTGEKHQGTDGWGIDELHTILNSGIQPTDEKIIQNMNLNTIRSIAEEFIKKN